LDYEDDQCVDGLIDTPPTMCAASAVLPRRGLGAASAEPFALNCGFCWMFWSGRKGFEPLDPNLGKATAGYSPKFLNEAALSSGWLAIEEWQNTCFGAQQAHHFDCAPSITLGPLGRRFTIFLLL
jgi:hypothetical protein